MQIERDKNFVKRSLYYTSKSYVNQIDTAEKYPQLKKVYFIGILDFAIFDTKEYLSNHLILDTKTMTCEIQDFEFTFIELQKFKLTLQECHTIAKKWIYFIQNASLFNLIPKEYENIQEFKTAFQTAKIYNWNKDELEIYDYICLNEGKKRSEISTALEDGIEQGRIQGIEEGLEKGIEQGIEQGLEKGLEQGKLKEKRKIIKNLLLANVSLDVISQTTGLSIDEIKLLKE
jgi:predicted transposase/invertase (TIGR01784 family)